MVQIAIVDDEAREREILVRYFQKLAGSLQVPVSVRTFESGDDLVEDYDASWDLICLDIEMAGSDGVTTAKEIRKLDTDVTIVFITNMAQMAIRGYEVHALDFLVKPIDYNAFDLKFRNLLTFLDGKKRKTIAVSDDGEIHMISTGRILYIEVQGHVIYFHTLDGVYRQRASLRSLEKSLDGLSFASCNSCYLVNLEYVRAVKKEMVVVGEEELKVSRSKKSDFLTHLANYLGGVQS